MSTATSEGKPIFPVSGSAHHCANSAWSEQPATPPLAAMVYRVGKGCRQYPFGSVEEFAAWAARKPYCNETLRVMPVKDYAMLGDQCLPAADAVAWVRQVLGGGV